MNYYKIRFYIGCTFFVLWSIVEYIFSSTIRSILGIDINNAIYIMDMYPIGLISLAVFLISFYLFKNLEKVHKAFSIKTELEILVVYSIVFFLPIITLGRVSTIITEENILKYDISGMVKKYYLTDIDEIQCEIYNTKVKGVQFSFNIIIDDENFQIIGDNNQSTWNAMEMIDEIARHNNIPKTINMNIGTTTIDDIKSYSVLDRLLNISTGTYKHIAYIEKICAKEEQSMNTGDGSVSR